MTRRRESEARIDALTALLEASQRALDNVARQRDDLRAELASTRLQLLAHERQLARVRAQRDAYQAKAEQPTEYWVEVYKPADVLIRSGVAKSLHVRTLPDTGPEPRELYPDLWLTPSRRHHEVTFLDGETVTGDRIVIRTPFRKES